MEKLLYAFWRGTEGADTLRQRFLRDVAPRIRALGAERVQLNVADFPDLTGTLVNFTLHNTKPVPDGLVSFWLTSAYRREPVEKLLAGSFERIAGYEVAESTILPNVRHPPRAGERTYGFSQVTFLQVPPRLTYEAWRQGLVPGAHPGRDRDPGELPLRAQRRGHAADGRGAAVPRHRRGMLPARGHARFAGLL